MANEIKPEQVPDEVVEAFILAWINKPTRNAIAAAPPRCQHGRGCINTHSAITEECSHPSSSPSHRSRRTGMESDTDFVERLTQTYTIANKEEYVRLFALARRGAAVQWSGIETAPRGGGPLLLLDMTGDEDRIGVGFHEEIVDDEGGVWLTFWENGARCNATMWMPLPPPPAGETE